MPSKYLYEQLQQAHFLAAMDQLLQARHGSELMNLDLWMMAVEMNHLLDIGCTMTQLRLLVAAGYLEHASEVTTPADETRCFRPESRLTFGAQTCFILTDAGDQFLKAAKSTTREPGCPAANGHSNGHFHSNGDTTDLKTPLWDAETRELRVGRCLVKRFRRPAPMLELVLACFQEMDWPPHLDDPLPPQHEIDPQQRLRDTVRRLNGCQEPFAIRFESDGLGAGIRWSHTDGPQITHT